jgi:hypothetical protein
MGCEPWVDAVRARQLADPIGFATCELERQIRSSERQHLKIRLSGARERGHHHEERVA